MMKKALFITLTLFALWTAVLFWLWTPLGWMYLGATLLTFPFWAGHNFLVLYHMKTKKIGLWSAFTLVQQKEVLFLQDTIELAVKRLGK